MQFQVPQFLDVEDKIIGPFTIKQFLYAGGGLGLGYMSFRIIPYVGALLGIGFVIFGAALAFYKYNNKPFVFLIESAFNYVKNARFYIWRRREKKSETDLNLNNFTPTKHETVHGMKAISSKLSDLAWSIDIPTEETPTEEHGAGLKL